MRKWLMVSDCSRWLTATFSQFLAYIIQTATPDQLPD